MHTPHMGVAMQVDIQAWVWQAACVLTKEQGKDCGGA